MGGSGTGIRIGTPLILSVFSVFLQPNRNPSPDPDPNPDPNPSLTPSLTLTLCNQIFSVGHPAGPDRFHPLPAKPQPIHNKPSLPVRSVAKVEKFGLLLDAIALPGRYARRGRGRSWPVGEHRHGPGSSRAEREAAREEARAFRRRADSAATHGGRRHTAAVLDKLDRCSTSCSTTAGGCRASRSVGCLPPT